MPTRFNKVHPALKHAGYSATTLLPGEDAAAFEKLHRAVIAEYNPVGALEDDIVADIARLMWRKQNLPTFRIAELANRRYQEIISENVPSDELHPLSFTDPAAVREGYRAAEEQARQELGDVYKLIEIGEPATIDGLMKELDIKERLDGLIDRCLKRLLMVRGVKSLSSAPSSVTPQISSSRKAGGFSSRMRGTECEIDKVLTSRPHGSERDDRSWQPQSRRRASRAVAISYSKKVSRTLISAAESHRSTDRSLRRMD